MIVAVSRSKVSAADAFRFEARFQSRPCLVDAHDGFLGLEVLRTVGRTPTFMLVTRWADRAALKRYMRSRIFARFTKATKRTEPILQSTRS